MKRIFLLLFAIGVVFASFGQTKADKTERLDFRLDNTLEIGHNITLGGKDRLDIDFGSLSLQKYLFRMRYRSTNWHYDWKFGGFWQFYKVGDDNLITADAKGKVNTWNLPEGYNKEKSFIHTYGWSSLLIAYYQLNEKHQLGLGLTYRNVYGNTKSRYKDATGETFDDMHYLRNLHRHVFGAKVEYYGKMGYIYATYSHTKLFLSNCKANNASILETGVALYIRTGKK